MTTKVTKKAKREFLKTQLSTNQVWAKQALIRIFEFQTQEEQENETTHDLNGIGFTGVDGEILSSFAKQFIRKNFLSPKQMAILMRKMPKYWNQILSISNQAKLESQVLTYLNN